VLERAVRQQESARCVTIRAMPRSSSARRLAVVMGAALLLTLPATASATTRGASLTVAGIRIEPPPPGYGVAVTAITTSGVGLQLVVGTDLTGVTRVLDDRTLAAPAAVDGIVAGPDACNDGKHAFPREGRFRWTRAWAWRFRATSTPDGMSKVAVEAHLRAAVRSITNARNDCGIPDRVSARAIYLGRTLRKPAVRRDMTCGRTDGRNVVGFGDLPQQVAGVTCAWFSFPSHGVGEAIEADVLLRRGQRWALRRRTCSRADNEVILRSVATHEFGHVFGLAHVRESTHGELTMSDSIGPCDDSAFTLGKGDIAGLERLY
jgi:hypothetical protein